MREDQYQEQEAAWDDWDDDWLDDEETATESARGRSDGRYESSARRFDLPWKRDHRCVDRNDQNIESKGFLSRPGAGRTRSAEGKTATTSAARTPAGTTSPLNDLLLLAFKVVLVAAFLIFMTTFFYGVTQARDTSMDPAVKEGDLIIYYRPDKDYLIGDAIVVDYKGELQVRRVVATAGDTVDMNENGGLVLNGSTQVEDEIYTQTYAYTDGITFPVTVGEGEVFVLGDNRTNAQDSRVYGTVSISATKGTVMTIIRRRGI